MKKLIAVLLTIITILSLTACAGVRLPWESEEEGGQGGGGNSPAFSVTGTNFIGYDIAGNAVYELVFSDGSRSQFTVPKGDKGRDGENGKNGVSGETPEIGANGNWWIGAIDTGIKAEGIDGEDGENGTNGRDGENGKNGKDGKDGKDGSSPVIGANGNWWINGIDTGVKANAEILDGLSVSYVDFSGATSIRAENDGRIYARIGGIDTYKGTFKYSLKIFDSNNGFGSFSATVYNENGSGGAYGVTAVEVTGKPAESYGGWFYGYCTLCTSDKNFTIDCNISIIPYFLECTGLSGNVYGIFY